MTAAEAIFANLAAGASITERILIVVAHPDDETIGIGAQLGRIADALLVHVTDGAPRDGEDARAHGFASVADYAAARQAELAAALRAGDAGRLRRLGLGIADKQARRDLAGLARRLAELLREERPTAVFTHAYEGGHPDHDSTAFAVHAACRLAAASSAIVEMPFYHRRYSHLIAGEFLPAPLSSSRRKPGSTSRPTGCSVRGTRPSPGLRVYSIEIAGEALRRKTRMIDCFATQRRLLDQFDLSTERFRIAPDYDFREPPHLGELHYETLGWGIASGDWRCAAADALRRLGFDNPRCR